VNDFLAGRALAARSFDRLESSRNFRFSNEW
jgi:hypothetical protein